jgi:phospholipase C
MIRRNLLGICIAIFAALTACATPIELPPFFSMAVPPQASAARAENGSSAAGASSAIDATGSSKELGSLRDKIKHVIIIMQENRSFDHYFGTYPGADGIPMQNGAPTVCVPDPGTKQCVKPFHDPNDKNYGGPHGETNATADINGGKMDGFVSQERSGRKAACTNVNDPACSLSDKNPDVMGWHDAREIPNYWAYAQNFVLQDKMFEPNASWSLPEHLFMVSEWSAACATKDPMSCVNALQNPDRVPKKPKKNVGKAKLPDYAWTDLTYLLHKNNVT